MTARLRTACGRDYDRPSPPLADQQYVICNWRDSAHPRSGGAEVYCEQLARQLASLGAVVTFLTSRPPGAARKERVDFGEVIRLGRTFTTYPLVLAWLAWHRRSIDGVVDSENGIPYFSPLAVGRSTPVILLVHHVHQDQFSLYFPPVLRSVARWLERTGTAWVYGRRPICAVSPSTRAAIRRSLAVRGRVFVAPNGVRLPDLSQRSRRDRSAAPRIVCVGRLVRHKRVDVLIRLIPRLCEDFPDLTVDVVGDGPERPGLEMLSQHLGLESVVQFHGRVDDDARDRIVKAAWLSVTPSAGEGWALSVMEAAVLGVPSVAMSVPGLQDSIRHRATGWLCDAEECLALTIARALETLRDPEEAARWSVRCQEWAIGFSWERAASLIHSVMSSETERLANRYEDRRRRNDATTVVGLIPYAASAAVISRLRRTDQLRVHEGRVELLLANADEIDAHVALSRIGLPLEKVSEIRVARPVDLLGWEVVGSAELVLATGQSIVDVTVSQNGSTPILGLNAHALLGE
jgi:glycosyltransferase involved in cell wall biosynthesis